MPGGFTHPSATGHVEAIRSAFGAALRGELDGVAELLADDVRWHAAGDESGGCRDRAQALAWMREAVTRGIRAEVLGVRALDQNRALVLLQRRVPGTSAAEPPAPHGQIVTFREGRVVDITVYASEEDAREAAGIGDAPV